MANMLYNGVELPAPPEWSNAAFTYFAISYRSSASAYHFWASSSPFTFGTKNGHTGLIANATHGAAITSSGGTVWDILGESYGKGLLYYETDGFAGEVWSNHDILNLDGTIRLAASDPVDPNAPAATYDRTAFLSGLAMGLCGKGNPTFEESGKMLYNGVELPALPDYDKVKYPYALVFEKWDYTTETHSGEYELHLLDTKLRLNNHSYYPQGAYTATSYRYSKDYNSGNWRLAVKDAINPSWQPGKYSRFVWANFDFLSVDGSVVVATSPDPVPVEDAFTKGYHAGAALRRKRVLPNSNE